MTDSSPLLPVSATPFSDLRTFTPPPNPRPSFSLLCFSSILTGPRRSRMAALSKRLPNGELEHTRRAIQGFFVLRELKYTLLRKKDFRLPLKER